MLASCDSMCFVIVVQVRPMEVKADSLVPVAFMIDVFLRGWNSFPCLRCAFCKVYIIIEGKTCPELYSSKLHRENVGLDLWKRVKHYDKYAQSKVIYLSLSCLPLPHTCSIKFFLIDIPSLGQCIRLILIVISQVSSWCLPSDFAITGKSFFTHYTFFFVYFVFILNIFLAPADCYNRQKFL